jgi:hypothetical protein
MTTLTIPQIPSNITTLEQLHSWSGLALRAVNGPKTSVENEGFLPERVAQCPIIETPNDGVRMLLRTCIQFDPSFSSDKTQKLWMFAKELTVGTMPIPYTSN